MDCSSPYAMARLIDAARPLRRRVRQRPRLTTATASSRASAGLLNPNHYLAVAIDYLFQRPRAAGRPDGRRRQDAGEQQHDRPRRGRPRPPARRGAGRASSGSSTGCSTARSASAARRAPAPRFLRRDGTRVDAPTRTASSSACSRRRSPRAPGSDPGELYAALDRALRRARLRSASTRRPRPRRRAALAKLVARAGHGDRARGRADRRAAHRARPATARRSAG